MRTLLVALILVVAGLAETPDGEIHIWPVQGNVYLLVGPGGNTTL